MPPTEDLLNQNLHLNKIFRWSGYSFKSEKQQSGEPCWRWDCHPYLLAWIDCPTLGVGWDVTSSGKEVTFFLPWPSYSISCPRHEISEHLTRLQSQRLPHFIAKQGRQEIQWAITVKSVRTSAMYACILVLSAHWMQQTGPCIHGDLLSKNGFIAKAPSTSLNLRWPFGPSLWKAST